jgi:hypothetical protein
VLTGRGITLDRHDSIGLEILGRAVLPFLLAARAQAVVAMEGLYKHEPRRFPYADGIASSFEAYRYTRSHGHDVDEDGKSVEKAPLSEEVQWYLNHIDELLPPGSDIWSAHPKILATAGRALELWKRGEKVLIFCFFLATGRALRRHISEELRRELVRQGAAKLGLKPDATSQVMEELERQSARFFDPDARVTRAAEETVRETLKHADLVSHDLDRTINIVIRFLRTPSFLVRYVEIGSSDHVSAIQAALDISDASGLTLRSKIGHFGAFVASRVPVERDSVLNALEQVQTGQIFAVPQEVFDPSEHFVDRQELLPNVRLANGQVRRETRQRLMLAFNTPFFPEVLIASAVMAEGVDLHLDCRYVIHHDLDWNPSVIEQRTGRVDRLGSKGEMTKLPIVVYQPYLEGTQDEKQFRVVKDRERWFNVVMGERMDLDERNTDQIARRIPLPLELAQRLTFDLRATPVESAH